MNHAQKKLETICSTCITRASCEQYWNLINESDGQYYGERMIAITELMTKCSIFRDLIIEAIEEHIEESK
jgi:hypothetical protein